LTNLFTATEENYIKAIYKHQQLNESIATNTLAMAIQIKASSVTDMLKKLKTKKIIHYKAYEGCKLTASGEKVALSIIRKHRLWETFLSEKLGFAWSEVHEIAEELEHVGHPELINKLDAFLGFPEMDPHGDPIPDENGNVKKTGYKPLHDESIGKLLVVKSVKSHEKGMLELLDHYDISIGASIELLKKFDFDDSIEVKINKNKIAVLAQSITKNILVK
jgi:DtxR family transcriptional regulator, Mn-dependent transcriptional regulator